MFAVLTTPANAQCGWPAVELQSGNPPALTTLLARIDSGRVPERGLERFHAWISNCDHVAGRDATLDFRRAYELHRDDMALEALLGVALARGPEVQWEFDGGTVLRYARRGSNSEKEAVRLLAEVSTKTGWPEIAAELAALGLATRSPATLGAAVKAL
jgi:hypothetical protein